MVLYHFCTDSTVKSILRRGITRGALALPTLTGYALYNGWQWLTADPDPAHQSWATRFVIRESRTAWRLTVEIPDTELHRLYDRQRLALEYSGVPALFDGWPGSANWRVYHGQIPAKWIKYAERMEG